MEKLRQAMAWIARRFVTHRDGCHICGAPVAPGEVECYRCWSDKQW